MVDPRAGTGGIWRIAAINEAGGWKDRTTVEDMDLAVRASLKGWKFVYLGDLQVLFTDQFHHALYDILKTAKDLLLLDEMLHIKIDKDLNCFL